MSTGGNMVIFKSTFKWIILKKVSSKSAIGESVGLMTNEWGVLLSLYTQLKTCIQQSATEINWNWGMDTS